MSKNILNGVNLSLPNPWRDELVKICANYGVDLQETGQLDGLADQMIQIIRLDRLQVAMAATVAAIPTTVTDYTCYLKEVLGIEIDPVSETNFVQEAQGILLDETMEVASKCGVDPYQFVRGVAALAREVVNASVSE